MKPNFLKTLAIMVFTQLILVGIANAQPYIITGSGTQFTATRNGITINANQPIQAIIDGIEKYANGAAIEIQFGNGSNVLNLGTESIKFHNGALSDFTGRFTAWGNITLSGKITSKPNTCVINLNHAMFDSPMSLHSKADIRNTNYSGFSGVICSIADDNMLMISEGSISGTILNHGTLIISGGYMNDIQGTGSVEISGNAYISSANILSTILVGGAIKILGGTIENTSIGAAVGPSAEITLGGSPNIIGRIEISILNILTSGNVFNPGSKIYQFVGTRIKNGKNFLANFTLYNLPNYVLTVDGNDLIVAYPIYAVTFNPNGGAVSPISAETTNKQLSSLPTPTRNGYDFLGWFTASTGGTQVTTNTVFNANTTIYAQWSIKKYKVTFNPNGGTVSPTSAETSAGWQLSSLPTPVRSGYDFLGWFTVSTGGSQVTTNTVFSANTTIYAQWLTNYTITYNLNGGTGANNRIYNIETQTITLPTPTREGYTFAGWFEDYNFNGTLITLIPKGSTGNKIYYAKWIPNKSTPIFSNRVNPSILRIGVQTIGNTIQLSNLPANSKVEIYNLQGKRIYVSNRENPRILRIGVPKGVYLVKAGGDTFKAMVR